MAAHTAAIERFRRSGGGTKPVTAGLKVCWGTDAAEAVRIAHHLRANAHLPGELAQIQPTPRHFEQASELVTPEGVGANLTCGDGVVAHVTAVKEHVDSGFDTVYHRAWPCSSPPSPGQPCRRLACGDRRKAYRPSPSPCP
jgi:hypothetical protein